MMFGIFIADFKRNINSSLVSKFNKLIEVEKVIFFVNHFQITSIKPEDSLKSTWKILCQQYMKRQYYAKSV